MSNEKGKDRLLRHFARFAIFRLRVAFLYQSGGTADKGTSASFLTLNGSLSKRLRFLKLTLPNVKLVQYILH